MLPSASVSVQWASVFEAALRTTDVAAVRTIVGTYLGAPPTASQVSAARRAARRQGSLGTLQLVRVRAPTGRGDHPILLIALPTADLSDTERLRAIALGRPVRSKVQALPSAPERAEAVVSAVTGAVHAAQHVDVATLDPEDAASLAAELGAALPHLDWLRRRLSGRADAVPLPGFEKQP